MVLKLSCPTLYLYDTLTVIKYEAGIADPRSFLYVQTQVIFNSRFDFSLLDADISLCNSCAAVLQKVLHQGNIVPVTVVDRNKKWYAVINVLDEHGQRKQKWICTDLPSKNGKANKIAAKKIANELQGSFTRL